jgi:hypothetical protein
VPWPDGLLLSTEPSHWHQSRAWCRLASAMILASISSWVFGGLLGGDDPYTSSGLVGVNSGPAFRSTPSGVSSTIRRVRRQS